MEEQEIPTDELQERIHEAAHRARERWISGVGLTSALLAVFAAVTALLAGHHSNEAMISQLRASNQWAYYQAKGVKANVLSAKMEILAASGHPITESDKAKIEEYRRQQDDIAAGAKSHEEESELHLRHHVIYARGVTLFQIGIAMSAISALLRRRRFWWVSLGFGAVGVAFLGQGLLL